MQPEQHVPQGFQVGILILNYHHPEDTLACVRRLLEIEGHESLILWLENDADHSPHNAKAILETSGLPWQSLGPDQDRLPPPGTVGFISIPENLGYAGGNNVGLRLLHRHGIPYAWVMNNDTLLQKGSSRDLIRAAEARPDIGIWGMRIVTDIRPMYNGAVIDLKDFSCKHNGDPKVLETNPLSYVSGCAMFFKTELGMALGGIPEDYFLYYEDPSFTFEIRRRGLSASAVQEVEVLHNESLSTGRRSALMEYYNRRNRWHFIQRYFPKHIGWQRVRFLYLFQKWLFRCRFDRIRNELIAFKDFKAGCMGRTHRILSRSREK